MRAAPLITLLLALAAGGVRAQEAPASTDSQPASVDPIGDAISAALPPDQSTDVEIGGEAKAVVSDPVPPVAEPPRFRPPLVIQPSPRSTLDRPVMIDETGVSPDGPPTPLDISYETRIRASLASAQGLQGPLDGGWTVRTSAGAPVLALQLVDRGQGYGQLEGAWRSLDGPIGRVGLIDSLDRQPVVFTVRITRTPGRAATVLSLVANTDGSWSGDLSDDTGVRPVTMRRN